MHHIPTRSYGISATPKPIEALGADAFALDSREEILSSLAGPCRALVYNLRHHFCRVITIDPVPFPTSFFLILTT